MEKTEFMKNLRTARQRKGFTLENLADAYNAKFDGSMCKETLSQYENGKYTPKLTTIINLANVLGVSVGWLINSEHEGIDKHKTPTFEEMAEKLIPTAFYILEDIIAINTPESKEKYLQYAPQVMEMIYRYESTYL